MPLKFNVCPHCSQKIVFRVNKDDIDNSKYPSPVYIHHNEDTCGKTSTFFLDSQLGVSYIEPEKKPGAIKTIETLKSDS